MGTDIEKLVDLMIQERMQDVYKRQRPGNGEERYTHRERRVQSLDQSDQCRYPGHQEENR